MSAAPTDYPTAVLEEADLAMWEAHDAARREKPRGRTAAEFDHDATRAGAQAYAAVLARYTVAARIAAEPGCYESLMHAFGANPDGTDVTDTEPPVDEDALAEARAYERGKREGFARAIRDGAAHLREIGDEKADSVVIAAGDWLEEWGAANADRLATRQGAASS